MYENHNEKITITNALKWQLKKNGYSDEVVGKFSYKFSVTIFFAMKIEN